MRTKVYKERDPEYVALQWTGDNIDEWYAEFDNVTVMDWIGQAPPLEVSLWKQKKRDWKDYTIPVSYYLVRKVGTNRVKVMDEDKFIIKYESKVA